MASHCKTNTRTRILAGNCHLKAVQVSQESGFRSFNHDFVFHSIQILSPLGSYSTIRINIKQSIILYLENEQLLNSQHLRRRWEKIKCGGKRPTRLVKSFSICTLQRLNGKRPRAFEPSKGTFGTRSLQARWDQLRLAGSVPPAAAQRTLCICRNYCKKPFSPPKLQISHATCVLRILMVTLLGIISYYAFQGPPSGSISWCRCIVGWNRCCSLPAQALRFVENRLQTTQIPAVCWTRTSLKKPFLVQIIPLITKSVVTAPGLYQNQ